MWQVLQVIVKALAFTLIEKKAIECFEEPVVIKDTFYLLVCSFETHCRETKAEAGHHLRNYFSAVGERLPSGSARRWETSPALGYLWQAEPCLSDPKLYPQRGKRRTSIESFRLENLKEPNFIS